MSDTNATTTGSEAQKYVETLLQRFRSLVIDLHDEQEDFRNKLSELPTTLTTRTGSSSTNDGSAPTTLTATATATTTTTTTNSSSLSSSTIRPPSYKTAVKPSIALTSATRSYHSDQPQQRYQRANNNDDRDTHHQHHYAHQHNRQRQQQQLLHRSTIHCQHQLQQQQQQRHNHHDHHHQQQQHQYQDEVPRPPLRTKRRSATLATTRNFAYNNMTTIVNRRGALIVLEGLDRVGKSTLAKKLVKHLSNTRPPVKYYRFPDRSTSVGKLIDEYLKSSSKQIDDHVMHMLFSANRWEVAKDIRNTINEGTTIVLDRYSYSGMAYSSAKRGMTLEWCCSMERGLPRPDLVIYLELPRDVQFERAGFGEERFETQEMQDAVRVQYEKILSIIKEECLRVDVENKNPDTVLGEVLIPVRKCLDRCASRELGNLDF